jgi:hypothetical protein
MHDISDARYLPGERADYKGQRLWRGNNWDGPRLRLHTLDSSVEQAVAIIDFTSRNNLTLYSADHSLHTELGQAEAEPGQAEAKLAELEQILGTPFFDRSLQAHWRWFSLNESQGPFYFPHFEPPLDVAEPQIMTSPAHVSLLNGSGQRPEITAASALWNQRYVVAELRARFIQVICFYTNGLNS